MAFEESPRFDGQEGGVRSSWRNWIARNRRWLLALAVLFLLVDALAAAFLLSPPVSRQPPGGLDGCLADANGQPLQATVRVGEVARSTYADGCFFFPALEPGSQQMRVETASGETFTQTVQIVPGKALGLGTISLP
ncbi:MAG: carboxypeptidase-like regulatory domain-containing protein [Chloroflexota bacterium]